MEQLSFLKKRPEWIRAKASLGEGHDTVSKILGRFDLTSVCMDAACPNRGECWDKKHVTFMVLGRNCTRGCSFCNIPGRNPETPDPSEPGKVAAAVAALGLEYAVITSVTRDDLEDKGAGHFVETVIEIREMSPSTKVELLIPDMDADASLVKSIALSGADVIGHNIEIPEAFYEGIRPGADYGRSLRTLSLLKTCCSPGTMVKSAIILGMGESQGDVVNTMTDLRASGVDILYLGQYLRPSIHHYPVKKFYTPQEFGVFSGKAEEMGFKAVLAGPMVRSSYRAYESYIAASQ